MPRRKRGGIRWTALAVLIAAAFAWSERDAIREHVLAARAEGEEAAADGVRGMSAEERLIRDLAAGFASRESRFDAVYEGDRDKLAKELPDRIREALAQDDYVRYSLASYVYTIRSIGDRSTIHIEARYRETKEQSEAVTAEVRQILGRIIEPGMNDHERVKAIHDWVVSNVDYDTGLKRYTAYEALKEGLAVCQGYSLLGYRMLTEAGITARIAEGEVNTGEQHAWNMVMLDGRWYHLDLTWDDPVARDGGASKDGRIRYTYYLRTDEQLRKDHSWTLAYPAADTDYADTVRRLAKSGGSGQQAVFAELQRQLGLHWLEPEYTVNGVRQLTARLEQALQAKAGALQFRYEQGERLAEDLKAAVNGLSRPAGYKATYEPYGTDGSVLVTLELTAG
ncbi:transglutaminase domain-containing protein [Paenibacillus thailandensis]|uniref:Transglutaminase domain-containing protein n=1 Tax=Paenibacillus thailandensis TaxID=393250 RepID=A0ABW5R1Z2_9BACL